MKRNKIIPQSVADKIVTQQLQAPKSFLLYCVTWNLAAKFPSITHLSKLLPLGFDIYVISTQECGQSIRASFVSSSMTIKWTKLLKQYFNEKCGNGTFSAIEDESLVALNMIIFVKQQTLLPHITNIESESIPTGIGGILGNKGAVAISFVYNNRYSFLFINSHFHAHQDNTILRHEDYWTINQNATLGRDLSVTPNMSNNANEEFKFEQIEYDRNIRLTSRFDFVFWMGDLNYRINGNRKIMDVLLREKQFNVLLQNDQLNIAKNYRQIFEDGFIESKITFPPTYKYDLNCDKYDTSSKARIPSWTDRILYKTNLSNRKTEFVMNTKYDAIKELKISDHRAVVATFKVNVNPKYADNIIELDGVSDSDYSMASIQKMNDKMIKKLSGWYHFVCFCVCCGCTKSSVWRRMFCLRAARVKTAPKLD